MDVEEEGATAFAGLDLSCATFDQLMGAGVADPHGCEVSAVDVIFFVLV